MTCDAAWLLTPREDPELERGRVQIIESLKAQQREAGVNCCQQAGCAFLSTERVHWPSVTGEPYPTYCAEHAEWAKRVLRALGIEPHADVLPPPPRPPSPDITRRIELGDDL